MSSEVNQQQSNFGANVANAMIFPAITTTIGAGISINAHGGIQNAIKAQKAAGESFGRLNTAMKNQGVDVFTRSAALAQGYEKYKNVYETKGKIDKKIAKLEKKQSKLTKKGNIQKANELGTQIESIKKSDAFTNADKAFKEVDKAVAIDEFTSSSAKHLDETLELHGFKKTKKGALKEFGETTFENATKTAAKGTKAFKSFGENVAKNFKNEFKLNANGALNYIMTTIQFIPNVINEVIPAFKEEGFIGGLKATGKTLVRAAADLVGYAAGGSIGRVIGSTIGMMIPFVPKGLGARIGGNIGDMICSMIVGNFITSKVDKIVGAEEPTGEIAPQTNETQVQVSTQDESQNKTQIAQQTQNSTTSDINFASEYAHLPNKQEVKQMAYAQAFQGKGGQFNRYYA